MDNWGLVSTALVGVAGIAATFFAPSWTERAIERRRENRSFRVAKRLVSHELHRLAIDLDAVAKQPVKFAPDLARFLDTPEWDAHGRTLAGSLSDPAWLQLSTLYTSVEKMRSALTIQHGEAFDAEEQALVKTMADLARMARAALEPPTGT